MIPKQSTLSVHDTLPGKETKFTIGDPYWIMESLSDLYSNKELATIRELSTNARDAQVEAGNGDKPIEVTLPNMMNPYFTVKDNGIGMSTDELEQIYTSFGTSTKRGSNDFNGMLGFGSKAPIAYTGTFTVTAIKNGIKTVGVINKKTNDIVLKVVMSSKTDEPNGVEIVVPVHNHEKFSAIARDFYRFWEPGTVLVNGVEPKQAVGEKIDDNLYYSTVPGVSYAVMGNVPYRIANPAALFSNASLGAISFVAYVPNGSLEFVPSREDLKYTDFTIQNLQKIIKNFENKMLTESKAQIEKAANHVEAWKAKKKWTDRLGATLFSGIEYKGEIIPDSITFKQDRTVSEYKIQQPGDYYNRYNTNRITYFNLNKCKNTVFITNFDKDLTSHDKGRVRTWADHKGITVTRVLFIEGGFTSVWVDSSRFITWDKLKSEIPRKQRSYTGPTGPTRIPGTFDYWTKAGWNSEKPLPTSGTIYYCTCAESKNYSISKALTLLNDDGTVIVLAKNRIDKFTRDNPTAKSFIDYARSQVVTDGESLIDAKAKYAMSIGYYTRNWVGHLDLKKVKDPAWQEIKDLISAKGVTAEYNKHEQLAYALGINYSFKRYIATQDDDSLYDKYPLLSDISYYNIKDDVYLYMNAKYEQIKKGNK